MQGYIKDYRKEIESDVWLMPPLYHRTWQWLKYNVNHEEAIIPMRDGSKLQIKRGQRLTSIRDLAKAIGWHEGVKWKEPNPKTVSTILDWMVKQGMIVIHSGKGNRQYTLITLINWEVYNPKPIDGNSKVTPRTTDREHPVDINKNDNNVLSNDEEFKRTTTTNAFAIFDREGFGDCEQEQESIAQLIRTYGNARVCKALQEASSQQVKELEYVKTILERNVA